MNSSTHSHTCTAYETDLSAILDGELKGLDLPATLDHLLDCPSCAEFYRKSRALGHAVANRSAGADGVEDDYAGALDRVWARIGERVEWPEQSVAGAGSPRASTGWRGWAPRLAAVLLLGFGLWLAPMLLRDGDGEPFADAERAAIADSADLQVRPGEVEMSEVRFVELATEVLRADPRYHRKMLEVMKTVTRPDHLEGAVDLRRDDSEAAEEEYRRGEIRSSRSLL